MTDQTAAILFFWLFVASTIVAAVWEIRARHWRQLFRSTAENEFRRYAREYIDQLPLEELWKHLPPQMIAECLMVRVAFETWKKLEADR